MTAVDIFNDKHTTPPVPAFPKSNGLYTIDADACDTKVGCVLLREQGDKILKSAGFWLGSLCDVKRRYGTMHKKCSAVVWVALMLRPYLEDSHFLVGTDHQPLQWISDLKEFTGRLV